jgi:Pentapeptide repeats (8 copies)
MTAVNNHKVSLSQRKYGVSRAIRNVSPPLGKGGDPKQKGFLNQPRAWAGGKTIWDLMDFLVKVAIPLAVVVSTLIFNGQQANLARQQHDIDQQHMLDQQQAAILQTYIDNIQDLLLNHNLLQSYPTDPVVILARARTLTALQGLDPERKGLLVKFIYDAGLINAVISPIISLMGANLSRAELHDASLGAANLSNTDLSFADMSNIILLDSDLSNANLSNADFRSVNLDRAKNLTQQQLDQVYSCLGATLPPGLTCHHENLCLPSSNSCR